MQKYPIGFNMNTENISADEVTEPVINSPEPRKSIVQVYFPSRDRSWPYYNDQFDLKLGDSVYVDGKLEGKLGKVININYSFKIKLSDYKKVIAQVDTGVEGEFHFVGSHAVTFDKSAINYSKIINWFKALENEDDYVSGDEVEVRLKFENSLVGVVYDTFGMDIPIIKDDENHFVCDVKVAVSPQFLSWVISFGRQAEIISPDTVIRQLYELMTDVHRVYEGGLHVL